MSDDGMNRLRPGRQPGRQHPLTTSQEAVALGQPTRSPGRVSPMVPQQSQAPQDPPPKKYRSNQ
jgi:hypothetical protein